MNDEEMIQVWLDELYNLPHFAESEERYDFESLAIGFFVAKGASPERAHKLYDICIKRNVF